MSSSLGAGWGGGGEGCRCRGLERLGASWAWRRLADGHSSGRREGFGRFGCSPGHWCLYRYRWGRQNFSLQQSICKLLGLRSVQRKQNNRVEQHDQADDQNGSAHAAIEGVVGPCAWRSGSGFEFIRASQKARARASHTSTCRTALGLPCLQCAAACCLVLSTARCNRISRQQQHKGRRASGNASHDKQQVCKSRHLHNWPEHVHRQRADAKRHG